MITEITNNETTLPIVVKTTRYGNILTVKANAPLPDIIKFLGGDGVARQVLLDFLEVQCVRSTEIKDNKTPNLNVDVMCAAIKQYAKHHHII